MHVSIKHCRLKSFQICLEKSYHPSMPPPSYFEESPPPYSVAVHGDRSPRALLDELQPEQRPIRNRNVSIIVIVMRFCKSCHVMIFRRSHISIGQDLMYHLEEKFYGTSRLALG